MISVSPSDKDTVTVRKGGGRGSWGSRGGVGVGGLGGRWRYWSRIRVGNIESGVLVGVGGGGGGGEESEGNVPRDDLDHSLSLLLLF